MLVVISSDQGLLLLDLLCDYLVDYVIWDKRVCNQALYRVFNNWLAFPVEIFLVLLEDERVQFLIVVLDGIAVQVEHMIVDRVGFVVIGCT